jgi:hypothetical protein
VPFARAGLHIGQHCCYLLGAVFKRNPALSQIEADDAPPPPRHGGFGVPEHGMFLPEHAIRGFPPAPEHGMFGAEVPEHGMFRRRVGIPLFRDAHPDPDDGGVWRHGDVIATLPEGARPTKKMLFACLASGCLW